MRMAAATWDGDALQRFGGGGSAWNEMTYDPETRLLYFGTAGAVPHLHHERSPEGLDNLFLSSVLAIHADNGEYAWHYQTVPQDSWDFNANMNIVLATLEIDGSKRDVAMIAPKNGFFYVLDKRTGELLSAEKFARVNWATHVNLETGRPVFDPAGEYWNLDDGESRAVWPNGWGAHNWQAMAFHPGTQLVYIPVADVPSVASRRGAHHYSSVQLVDEIDGKPHAPGKLLAWDPVRQQERWHVAQVLPFNGGVLATAGNLVVQGDLQGAITAYAANSGDRLWVFSTGTAINAAPVTFMHRDRQLIVVAVGAGGGMQFDYPELHAAANTGGNTRLLAFALDSDLDAPVATRIERPLPTLPDDEIPPQVAALGEELYQYECRQCHGNNAAARRLSTVPDLRYSNLADAGPWIDKVINGGVGMPPHDYERLEVDAIRLYVLQQARRLSD